MKLAPKQWILWIVWLKLLLKVITLAKKYLSTQMQEMLSKTLAEKISRLAELERSSLKALAIKPETLWGKQQRA